MSAALAMGISCYGHECARHLKVKLRQSEEILLHIDINPQESECRQKDIYGVILFLSEMRLTYEYLKEARMKGRRNGNWKRLRKIERVFFSVSVIYARIRGCIISAEVVDKLILLIKKIYETPSLRIFRRGFENAIRLWNKCPQIIEWLGDPDFIFWLGLSRVVVR